METLSSSLTFLHKVVLPPVWSSLFALGAVSGFLSEKPEVRETRWQFAAAWLVGSALIWGMCAGLKRVQIDGAMLVISNYWHVIRVPVTAIQQVKQNRFINPRPVTITFTIDTRFGRAIKFMPRTSFRMFSEDEVVSRLRQLANPSGSLD